jgi:hypothetical protein
MAKSTTEELWYANHKSFLALITVLAAALSLPYFRLLNDKMPNVHPAIVSVLIGIFVALMSYIPMYYVSKKYALSNAVLLGFVSAEFCVYGAPCTYPAPLVIVFFFLLFLHAYEERGHVWPDNNNCSIHL